MNSLNLRPPQLPYRSLRLTVPLPPPLLREEAERERCFHLTAEEDSAPPRLLPRLWLPTVDCCSSPACCSSPRQQGSVSADMDNAEYNLDDDDLLGEDMEGEMQGQDLEQDNGEEEDQGAAKWTGPLARAQRTGMIMGGVSVCSFSAAFC